MSSADYFSLTALLGMVDCSFEARNDNKEEVKNAMPAHVQKYHEAEIAGLSDSEENNIILLHRLASS